MDKTYFGDTRLLSNEARILHKYGMKSAALFYMNKNEPALNRMARVFRCTVAETYLPKYTGQNLYPSGRWMPSIPDDDIDNYGLRINCWGDFLYRRNEFAALIRRVEDPFEKTVLNSIAHDMSVYNTQPMSFRYAHGGEHWVMDYERLLSEGLGSYRRRILKHLANSEDVAEKCFYQAMLDVVDGLLTVADRIQFHLEQELRVSPADNLDRLVKAYGNIPKKHPNSFFEAVLGIQFFMGYLSSSEPGRLDQYLAPYFARDVAASNLTEDEASHLIAELISSVDERVGSPGAWHMTLGGSDRQGNASYNQLTRILLKVMRDYRQPNTSLRVRPDMPEDIWSIALENFAAGCGNPALINDEAYRKGFKEYLGISTEDFADLAFGGCTETLIAGKSNVNSIGSKFNLADVLEQTIARELLRTQDFEQFYTALLNDLDVCIRQLGNEVGVKEHFKGVYKTDPVRTLLTDDCLDKAVDYYAGGARYNFENTSIYGLANVVDSLYVIKHIFEGKIDITRQRLLDMLAADFNGYEAELKRIMDVPKFGRDPQVNDIAKELTEFVFTKMKKHRGWRGKGHITPSIIGWITFVNAGKHVGATPDGRKRGAALADSTGPMQGMDTKGPTAVLSAAGCLPQYEAVGTCVLNLMFDRAYFGNKADQEKIKNMLRTYFELGGLQIQLNVYEEELLQKALREPDKYRNLTVRVAGYNDYFVKQSPSVQAEILKRTRHGGRD